MAYPVKSDTLAFFGRTLFAFLFLSSGFQKFTTFDVQTGGPAMPTVSPKIDTFLHSVEGYSGFPISVDKDMYIVALWIAMALEVVGGILFLLNFNIGAYMLSLFLLGMTPVMHAFWNEPEGDVKTMEMIQFFKNVALLGGLLFYVGGKPKGSW